MMKRRTFHFGMAAAISILAVGCSSDEATGPRQTANPSAVAESETGVAPGAAEETTAAVERAEPTDGEQRPAPAETEPRHAPLASPETTSLDFSQVSDSSVFEPIEIGSPITKLEDKGVGIGCVYAPDGSRLYAASTAEFIAIYHPTKFEKQESWPLEAEELEFSKPHHVVLSLDGSALAVADTQHRIRIIDTITGKERASFAHDAGIEALALSPDGKTAVSSDFETTSGFLKAGSSSYIAWDAVSGKELWSKKTQWRDAKPLAIAPDGQTVVLAGMAGIELCELRTGRTLRKLEVDEDPSLARFSPDGTRLLLVATIEGENDTDHIALVNVADLKTVWVAPTGFVYCDGVAFSPDGTMVVAIGGMKRSISQAIMTWWDAASGRMTRRFARADLDGPIHFSPDGKQMAARMEIWDTAKLRSP